MNKVILVGRLARDPELKSTTTGKSVANFTVAVDRKYKNEGQPTADFISVVAWNKAADIICQYLGKGRRIALEGNLQVRSYDAKDGTKRYVTEVVLESFDFVDNKQESSQATSAAATTETTPLDLDEDFHLMAEDEEVPF